MKTETPQRIHKKHEIAKKGCVNEYIKNIWYLSLYDVIIHY